MTFVDLRSDTVTRPTAAMRRAMAEAEVGDDGYGEDPTVRRLEEAYALRVGKQAALYVPSGTMANQLAMRVLGKRGGSVIAGRRQHVVVHEAGAAGVNAQVQFHIVDDPGGVVSPDDVSWAREASLHHWPTPTLVCVENTHMTAGGVPWSVDELATLRMAAGDLPIHMDGARLFNASVATLASPSDMAAEVTTVMSCLSKGLCAPVGSILAGPGDVIAEARIERQRMGGGMRQAGVIAAAGLVALESMVERLAEDHARARRLAEAVAERWPDAGCDPKDVLTNIVVFDHDAPDVLASHLRGEGVLAATIAPRLFRFVTHNDVDDADIERTMAAIASSEV